MCYVCADADAAADDDDSDAADDDARRGAPNQKGDSDCAGGLAGSDL